MTLRPAADALRDACHRVGFFQLTGYGVTAGQVDGLFEVTRRFFNLPEADRLALDNRKSPHFRGYTRLGRYTVPFFRSPRLDAVIDPVPLPPALAAQSRGLSDDPNNPMLASYWANVPKGWLRAHPEVARLHHPELVQQRGTP